MKRLGIEWNVPDPGKRTEVAISPTMRPLRSRSSGRGAPRHLERRAAREREEQDALRVGAARNEVRDAMRERIGLARPGAGEDQERPLAMARRRALRRV